MLPERHHMQAVRDPETTHAKVRETLAQSLFEAYDSGVKGIAVESDKAWVPSEYGGLVRDCLFDCEPCTFYVDFEYVHEHFVVRAYAKDRRGNPLGYPLTYSDAKRHQTLHQLRSAGAAAIYQRYTFGAGVTVAAVSDWDFKSHENEWTRSVFVESDGKDTAEKLTFTVRFFGNSILVAEIHARDRRGIDVGTATWQLDGQLP